MIRPDYEALIAARRTLADQADALVENIEAAGDYHDAFCLGLVHEACDRAAEAIFDALNIASSYLDDGEAHDAHRAHWAASDQ